MGVKDKLIENGVGTWVFIGSFLPATLFALMSIATSTLYFFVDHKCSSRIDSLYYVGIALGKVLCDVDHVHMTTAEEFKDSLIRVSLFRALICADAWCSNHRFNSFEVADHRLFHPCVHIIALCGCGDPRLCV